MDQRLPRRRRQKSTEDLPGADCRVLPIIGKYKIETMISNKTCKVEDSDMNFKGRKILVTGASGFIGRHVVSRCMAFEADTIAVDLNLTGIKGLREIAMDLTNAESLKELIQREVPDGVIHLASAGITYNSETLNDLFRINVLPLDIILKSVAEVNPDCHVVITGSGFEYLSSNYHLSENAPLGPKTPYGVSKVAATMLAGTFSPKVKISVVRPFSVYGVGEKEPRLVPYIINQAFRGLPVELTGCQQIRDYLFVEDLADAFLSVLAHPPTGHSIQIFNAGSGQAVTLAQLIEVLKISLKSKGINPDIKMGALPYRESEIMHYVANVEHIQKITGWRSRTSLIEGLRAMVDESLITNK